MSPVPVVTCSADAVVAYNAAPQLVNLGATATNAPILSWQWTILSVPTGSTANVGVKGDFTNGTAVIQNPQLLIDGAVAGGYTLQCIATNATGASIPTIDRELAQQAIIMRTSSLALYYPGDYLYDWGKKYLVPTLGLLEAAIGGAPPAIPNAKDDEFNAAVLDGKWAWIRAGAPSAVSGIYSESWGLAYSKIWARVIQDSAPRDRMNDVHAISQAVPGGDWTITTKATVTFVVDYSFLALFTDDGSNTNVDEWKTGRAGAGQYRTVELHYIVGGGDTFDQLLTPNFDAVAYLRMQYVSAIPKLVFSFSADGICWVKRGEHNIGYAPSRFGLSWHANTNGGGALEVGGNFEYFRVTQP